LALVKWVTKNKARREDVECHGLGAAPIRKPGTVDQVVGEIGTEAMGRSHNTGSKSC